MQRRLIIIDGHALMHRAWHALPPLTAKDGTVVSGAYGFTMILLKAIKELQPTHVVVTFDLAGPTFRHEEYKDYKATREKKPDELYEQFPIAEDILQAMDIPVYTAEGYEADDVIGTIAKQVVKDTPDIEVVIVTGDKDTLQLVDERIKVYTLRKGMTDTVLYDEEGVIEKMNIRPDQLVDYKALRGDPSDNIPGVRGVGDKTAVALLREYETLDKLYVAIDKNEVGDMRDALRNKLEDSRDDAYMSQDLAEIRLDVPTDFALEDAEYRMVTREMVQDIFETYQFNRLLNQLPKADSEEGRKIAGQGDMFEIRKSEKPEIRKNDVEVITAGNEAQEIFEKMVKSKRIAFRTLTEGQDRISLRVRYLAVCDGANTKIISIEALSGLKNKINALLGDAKKKIICFDLKEEMSALENMGIGIEAEVFDLMVASYLLHAGERRHSLESILSFNRNVAPPEKGLDENAQVRRLAQEVSHFLSLAEDFASELEEHNLTQIFSDMEVPLAAVLSRMERNGIQLDASYLTDLSSELGSKIDKLTKQIHKLTGDNFNINSPGQLKEILFNKLGISTAGIKKTVKGKTLSTAASELEKIKDEHEVIPLILEYRELTKLKSTYVDALPPLVEPTTKRIYANFNQTVTATGRLSSSNPNLQNIPTSGTEYGKKVRDAFVAGRGFTLIAADYSQIELRIAAHIAEEKSMIEAFKNGEDIHWSTAVAMFGEERAKDSRRIAKAINFGILYGMGAQRLAISADISYNEAREYIDTYFALHEGIAEYIQSTKNLVAEQGYVETMFGRKRFFPNFHLLNPRERSEAERQAVNMPIQGTSADMIKKAMVNLDELFCHEYGFGLKASVRMVSQVHDELVFEVKNKLVDDIVPIIREGMEGIASLSVPIVVDVKAGDRWGSMKDRD